MQSSQWERCFPYDQRLTVYILSHLIPYNQQREVLVPHYHIIQISSGNYNSLLPLLFLCSSSLFSLSSSVAQMTGWVGTPNQRGCVPASRSLSHWSIPSPVWRRRLRRCEETFILCRFKSVFIFPSRPLKSRSIYRITAVILHTKCCYSSQTGIKDAVDVKERVRGYCFWNCWKHTDGKDELNHEKLKFFVFMVRTEAPSIPLLPFLAMNQAIQNPQTHISGHSNRRANCQENTINIVEWPPHTSQRSLIHQQQQDPSKLSLAHYCSGI